MRIGVITPMLNAEKTIERAINSVKNQSITLLTVYEIVHYIFNDASDDKSQDIVSNIKKPYGYTIWINNSNEKKGQSFARNNLMKSAISDNCDYIAFLDADDEWKEFHLESCISQLNENDIIYSLPEFINDKKEILTTNIPIPKVFIGKYLEYGNFIWISSVVAKAKCFIQNEFDSELDSLEDYDMWYRLWKQGYKFIQNKESTINYYVNLNTEASKASLKVPLFRSKHGLKKDQKLNLHLACGEDYQEGYINVDLYPTEKAKIDAQFDVSKIPFDDNTVDTIRALHIIEHFSFTEGQKVLNEWYRVLKPGGKLILETPDLLATCQRFVNSDEQFRITLYRHLFAYPDLPGQIHKFLFTETQLRCQLGWAGFKDIKRINPMSNYVMPQTVDLFLATECVK